MFQNTVNGKSRWVIVLAVISLIALILGCASPPLEEEKLVSKESTSTPTPTPIPEKMTPTPTPTPLPSPPRPTPTPRPEEATPEVILYEEDFETGTAEGWMLHPDWDVELIDGDYALCSSAQCSGAYWSSVFLGSPGWSDYTLETKVKVDSGHFHICFRKYGQYLYWIGVPRKPLLFCYLNKFIRQFIQGQRPPLASLPINLEENKWYTFRIVLKGTNIKVYLDDELIINYTDTDDPIMSGTIGFEAGLMYPGQYKVCFDDIKVTGPMPAPEQEGVLFQDDFEDGRADEWELQPGWSVKLEDGNHVLSGSGHSWAIPVVGWQRDYTIETEAKLVSGSFHFNFRYAFAGPTRYFCRVDQGGLCLSKQIGEEFWHSLAVFPIPLELNRWYTIKVVVAGPDIKIYVDEKLNIHYIDKNNPILMGMFSFETLDNCHVHFDDIIVKREKMTPTPTPTPSRSPSRPPPTARPTPAPEPIPTNIEVEILLPENFESGTQSWSLEEGWHTKRIDNNTVLRGKGHRWARLINGSWDNYAFKARFKIIQGTIHFNYRHKDGLDGPYRYFIGVNRNSLYLNKQIGDRFLGLTSVPISLNDGWHEIEIRGHDNTINIHIDNTLYILYKDDDPILSGGIAFETLERSAFLIDYVEIRGVSKEDVITEVKPIRVYNTSKSGILIRDEIWSGEIYVTGDIFVPEDVTLTIEPGTIIKMAANSDDQHSGGEHVKDELTWDREKGVWKDPSATKEYTQSHINFNVEGTLIAIGTPDKQIIFTSDSDSPYYLDWDHMVIRNGTVKYTVFEWAHAGPNISNGVFSNNIVRHMFWGGIHAYDGSPLIENNLVEDIGHEGIDTLRSSAIIRNNIIRKTRTSGIVTRYAGYDGKPTIIEGNLIINGGPIHLQMHSNAIVRNNILLRGDLKDDADTINYLGYQLSPLGGPPAGVGSGSIILMDFVNATILNNILVGNAIEYIPASQTYAIHEGIFGAMADKPMNVDIRNNIIIVPGRPINSEIFENFIIKYNLFWNEPPEFDPQLPYFSDETNIIANPLFISPEDMDFHLMPDSPAINHGDPEIKDKDGTRSDMGVYGGPYAKEIYIIDAHAHLIPQAPPEEQIAYIDKLVSEMDRLGVMKATLEGLATQCSPKDDQDILAAYDRYPDRFYPYLSGFNPQDEAAIDYVEKQLEIGKWKGLGEIYLRHSDAGTQNPADHPVG